jgi:hypothetical protein
MITQIWKCSETAVTRVYGLGAPEDATASPLILSAGNGKLTRHTYAGDGLENWQEFRQGQ